MLRQGGEGQGDSAIDSTFPQSLRAAVRSANAAARRFCAVYGLATLHGASLSSRDNGKEESAGRVRLAGVVFL